VIIKKNLSSLYTKLVQNTPIIRTYNSKTKNWEKLVLHIDRLKALAVYSKHSSSQSTNVRGALEVLTTRMRYTNPRLTYLLSAVFPCIGALGTPSRTGPLARTYLPGFPYSWSLRRLRQKISSIYCTVICNYPSAAQEQPFTVGLFCITKTVKLTRYALLVFVRSW